MLQKTASGIFLPSSSTSSPLPEATVIAVGPGAPNKDGSVVPTQVKAGDRVLLPGWGGNSIKVGDEVGSLVFCRGFGPVLMIYRNFNCSKILRSLQRFRSDGWGRGGQ